MQITNEAVLAGVDALLRELGTCDPGPLFDHSHVILTIYEAMAPHLAPSDRKPVTIRLDTSDLERQLAEFTRTVAEFKEAVEAATQIES